MIKIIVSDEIISHCKSQIANFNFGQRGVADGNKEQQFTGIIGQSVIMNLFGLGLIDGSTGFDQGKDLSYEGKIIDVKTMGRTTDVRIYYVNNFLGLQKNYNTDIYVFCSFNKTNNELTICGWVTKEQFKNKAPFFPKGAERKRSDGSTFKTFADLYEIANADLNDVNTLKEFKEQIKNA